MLYKLLRNSKWAAPFINPPPPTAQTDHHRNFKFGMDGHLGHSFGLIEAIFDKCPLSWDMGVGVRVPLGVKNYENFFWIFLFFSLPMVRSNLGMTKNQEIIPKFQFCGIKRAFGVLLKGQNLRFKTLLFPIKWELWDKFVYLGCGRTRSNQWKWKN